MIEHATSAGSIFAASLLLGRTLQPVELVIGQWQTLLGARAAYDACERAILTHGGYGYAKEFHVERFLREVMIARIAPVSEQLVLCYVAERVLGLPKSY